MQPDQPQQNQIQLDKPTPDSAAPQPMPDTSLICLVILARLHGIAAEPDQIARAHN